MKLHQEYSCIFRKDSTCLPWLLLNNFPDVNTDLRHRQIHLHTDLSIPDQSPLHLLKCCNSCRTMDMPIYRLARVLWKAIIFNDIVFCHMTEDARNVAHFKHDTGPWLAVMKQSTPWANALIFKAVFFFYFQLREWATGNSVRLVILISRHKVKGFTVTMHNQL